MRSFAFTGEPAEEDWAAWQYQQDSQWQQAQQQQQLQVHQTWQQNGNAADIPSMYVRCFGFAVLFACRPCDKWSGRSYQCG